MLALGDLGARREEMVAASERTAGSVACAALASCTCSVCVDRCGHGSGDRGFRGADGAHLARTPFRVTYGCSDPCARHWPDPHMGGSEVAWSTRDPVDVRRVPARLSRSPI